MVQCFNEVSPTRLLQHQHCRHQCAVLLIADHLLNLACSVLSSDWAMITLLEDTTASLAGNNGRTSPALCVGDVSGFVCFSQSPLRRYYRCIATVN